LSLSSHRGVFFKYNDIFFSFLRRQAREFLFLASLANIKVFFQNNMHRTDPSVVVAFDLGELAGAVSGTEEMPFVRAEVDMR
jgi:hypothetical protein